MCVCETAMMQADEKAKTDGPKKCLGILLGDLTVFVEEKRISLVIPTLIIIRLHLSHYFNSHFSRFFSNSLLLVQNNLSCYLSSTFSCYFNSYFSFYTFYYLLSF